MISVEEASVLVFRIVSGIPLSLFDEEHEVFWSVPDLELVEERTEGTYKGSREIGSGNLVAAFNLLYQKSIANSSEYEDFQLFMFEFFKKVINHLQSENKIRKKPELVRQQFKVVV